jgi:hypothetical protein
LKTALPKSSHRRLDVLDNVLNALRDVNEARQILGKPVFPIPKNFGSRKNERSSGGELLDSEGQ